MLIYLLEDYTKTFSIIYIASYTTGYNRENEIKSDYRIYNYNKCFPTYDLIFIIYISNYIYNYIYRVKCQLSDTTDTRTL